MLGGIRDKLSASGKKAKLKGSAVVLSRKVLDASDLHAIVVDNIYEIFGNSITCQLISATVTDPSSHLCLPCISVCFQQAKQSMGLFL